MSKQEDNKAIVGRWFTEFWGKTVNLGVINDIAAPVINWSRRWLVSDFQQFIISANSPKL